MIYRYHSNALVAVILCIVFLSCADTDIVESNATTGEIYGMFTLTAPYSLPEPAFAGIQCFLKRVGTDGVIATATTNDLGEFSFSEISAGVYRVQLYKMGYAGSYNPDGTLNDSLTLQPFQFVGRDRWKLDTWSLRSRADVDSALWAINPTLKYTVSTKIDTSFRIVDVGDSSETILQRVTTFISRRIAVIDIQSINELPDKRLKRGFELYSVGSGTRQATFWGSPERGVTQTTILPAQYQTEVDSAGNIYRDLRPPGDVFRATYQVRAIVPWNYLSSAKRAVIFSKPLDVEITY